MKLDIISTQLKEKLHYFNDDTVSMSPWQIADFLLHCREILLKYVEYSNKQLESDSEAFLSKSDIEKISGLFKELGDNFFPMAHTTAPLSSLKIVNAYEYGNLNNRVEDFLLNIASNYAINLDESIEMNKRHIEFKHQQLDEIFKLREEIRNVLNP